MTAFFAQALSLLLLVLWLPLPLVAQGTTSSAASAAKLYRVQTLYTAGVAQTYEITEQTSATRWYSDSSQKTYDRTITYFTTIRCIESMNGIARIIVNVDSMRYRFSAEGRFIEYDSEKDVSPKNFADLNAYIGPLNRPFTLTVSPYGEVTKIEGEQISYWREYLADNAAGVDSVVHLMWTQAMSDANLLHYGDLQKRVVPGLNVGVDSTWNASMALRLDGVEYQGRTKARLTSADGGLLTLAVNDTLTAAAPQDVHVYGIPNIVRVQEGLAAIEHSVQLNRTGTIQQVENIASTWMRAQVLMEVFTQRARVTTTWKLTGQYQW